MRRKDPVLQNFIDKVAEERDILTVINTLEDIADELSGQEAEDAEEAEFLRGFADNLYACAVELKAYADQWEEDA